MPTLSINAVEYSSSQNGPIIHVFGRDAQGVARRLDIVNFQPYFFALDSSPGLKIPLPRGVTRDARSYVSIKGEPCTKIYVEIPSDVRKIRDKFTHLEADVVFTTRFLIDNNLKSGITFQGNYKQDYRDVSPVDVDYSARICIVDIECSDEHGWPDATQDPITCITCYDSFDHTYTTFLLAKDMKAAIADIEANNPLPNGCFDPDWHAICVYTNESDMIRAFATYIRTRDPDILTGWNFTGFDAPYILGRMDALRINQELIARLPGRSDKVVIRGRQIFDLLAGYKRMHLTQKESYRLDAIAKEEVGEQKIHFSGKICALSLSKLIEYNFKDVELCVKINDKDEIVEFHREIAKYVGCPLEKTLNSMPIIDTYILRKAHGRFVLPSKSDMEAGEQFEGATVFPPVKGLHENTVVLDLTSLYPMVMVTGNMSPDTKDPNGEIITPIGVRFKKHPDGIVREIQTEFFEERTAMKKARGEHPFGSRDYKLFDMKQNVIKVLMNSYYGVSGNVRFRLHDREIGASVTAVGRKILEHNKKLIEEEGYKVIFGDSVGKDSKIDLYDTDTGKLYYHGPIEGAFDQMVTSNRGVSVTTIDDCDGEPFRYFCFVNGISTQVINPEGKMELRPINYLMRHKAQKKMYRVNITNTWNIDVTEDHSLIRYVCKGGSGRIFRDCTEEMKPTEAMAKTRWLVTKHGFSWKPTSIIHKGADVDIFRAVSVKEIPYDGYVYDIEVVEIHNFFANNILVHNTDSNGAPIPAEYGREKTIEIARALEKKLNDSYPAFAKKTLNADVSYFSVKFEKLYARFFSGGKKKRYAGLLVWKEGKDVHEIDIVGFETKRSDTPAVTKLAQKLLMEMLLEGKGYEETRKEIRAIVKKYRAGGYPLDEIGIPGGIGKALSKYETKDAQIRGAEYANQYLGANFGKGSKPKRLYVKAVPAGYPRTDVICFEYPDQVPPGFVVDLDTMLEKTIEKPLSRIMEALDWNWNEFDPGVSTLSQWGIQ